MPNNNNYNNKNKNNNYKGNNHGRNHGGGNYHGKGGRNSGSKVRPHLVKEVMPVSEGPHAPYNFIPFGSKILEDPNQMAYSVISDDVYTGEIRYAVTAETPILVDSGNDEFYRDKDGNCAMPGSTMRGLVRSNVQILSFSDMRDDVDDYRLMYRAVASGCLNDSYTKVLGAKRENKMSVLTNVKAGYIVNDGGKYTIYGHEGDQDGTFGKNKTNYFVLNERKIWEKNLDNFSCLQDLFQTEPPFEKRKDRNNRVHFRDSERRWDTYKPYSKHISYDTKKDQGGKTAVCAVAEEDVLPHSGFVLSSGRMKEKKAFYVIPEIDMSNRIMDIPAGDIEAYKVDFNRRVNTIKKDKDFYDLPEDGDFRPVFYIDLDGILYFGYTPHLRLFYKYTIRQGIPQYEIDGLDFAKSMFGFSRDDDSGKSKVFFTDAVLQGEEKQAGSKKLILSEPKPTSYLEYLDQQNGHEVSTYNDDKMRLRGVKQYWLHKNPTEGAPSEADQVKSTINPLEAGSRFEGSIRFQNLSKEELGLLLWSLELEEDSKMNVGKAKPFGYGRVKIDDVELNLLDPKAAYGAGTDVLSEDPMKKSDDDQKKSFVDNYKDFLSFWLNEDIMQNATIKAFLEMKSQILTGKTVEYMTLKEYGDFNKRYSPLPTVQEVVDSEQQ